MRLIPSVTAASLIAVLALPFAASSTLLPPAGCEKVYAEGDTTWMPDAGAELGQLAGLLNGAFYLAYQDEGELEKLDRPNFVIKTENGRLALTMAGKSTLTEEGTWSRELVDLAAEGDGLYADATVDLLLIGTFFPDQGGTYRLIGTICTASK